MEVCKIKSLADAEFWPIKTSVPDVTVRIYSISEEDFNKIPPTGALAAFEDFVDHTQFSKLELLSEEILPVEENGLDLKFNEEAYYYVEFEAVGSFYEANSRGYHYFIEINSKQ
jgi:hypothetical protein